MDGYFISGKREVKVKALEAAENAKRQEEQREYERRLRRMEGHETKGTMLECIKEMGTRKGVAEKVKRAAEVKMKIDQEKAKKQEEEKRKKEEERRILTFVLFIEMGLRGIQENK